METVWCQWKDIQLPVGYNLLSSGSDLEDQNKLSEISIYVPAYMGGISSLKMMKSMPKLKFVQLLTAGFEGALAHLPNQASLSNARGVHDQSTAELALGLTLASRCGILDYHAAQHCSQWLTNTRGSIIDSAVAIIGFGSIGQEIAKVFSPFTKNITGYTRSGLNGSRSINELDHQLGTYDIVILITPLTNETRGMFDANRLALMKPGALLVNVARGPIIVTDDLIAVLNQEQIFAALDVTDPEPLPADHPLWKAKNLIISPHVGGNSAAFPSRAKNLISTQLAKLATGELPANLIVQAQAL
jgi:phosphoglycerate dehydrogenase-like enzyme